MFKPSPSLHARVEARLRGWRGPPTKLLRDEKKRTDPLALAPAFGDVLFNEPQRGLPLTQAHKMMGLPMDDVLGMRGQRQTTEDSDIMQTPSIPRYGETEVEALQLGIARQKQKSKANHPYRARRGVGSTADTQGLLPTIKIPRKPFPARYKPPSTSYWRHSIYTYNKHASKDLAATTANTNKMIRAYFNMAISNRYQGLLDGGEPPAAESTAESQGDASAEQTGSESPSDVKLPERHINNMAKAFKSMTPQQRLEYPVGAVIGPWRLSYKQQLASLYREHDMTTEDGKKALRQLMRTHEKEIKNSLKLHKTMRDRVWVSDRGYTHHGMLRQDILGKISQRMQPKSSFHYPFKEIVAVQPQITYKHYRDGVGVSVHVHAPKPEPAASTRSRRMGSD